MSDIWLGQIEIFAFDFPPKGWVQCAGQLLLISQNQVLFSIIGTAFGGDGVRTFALPDLRGRTPIGQGNGDGLTPRPIGTMTGEPNHLVTGAEMPSHSHEVQGAAITDQNQYAPASNMVLASSFAVDPQGIKLAMNAYAVATPALVSMAAEAVSAIGDVHPNMMPYVVLNPCISLTGPRPSPT